MAMQLLTDLYGCDTALLNDSAFIRQTAHNIIKSIGAEIVEECVHTFSPIGISYIAVITTSHFSVHTWPEYGYAAIDVFSCHEQVPETVSEALKTAFHANRHITRSIERDLKGGCPI